MVFVDDVSTPVVDDILASFKVKPFLAGVSGTFSSSQPRRLPLGVPVGASMKGTSHKGDLVDFIILVLLLKLKYPSLQKSFGQRGLAGVVSILSIPLCLGSNRL